MTISVVFNLDKNLEIKIYEVISSYFLFISRLLHVHTISVNFHSIKYSMLYRVMIKLERRILIIQYCETYFFLINSNKRNTFDLHIQMKHRIRCN